MKRGLEILKQPLKGSRPKRRCATLGRGRSDWPGCVGINAKRSNRRVNQRRAERRSGSTKTRMNGKQFCGNLSATLGGNYDKQRIDSPCASWTIALLYRVRHGQPSINFAAAQTAVTSFAFSPVNATAARPSESRPHKEGTASRNEPPRHRVRGPPSARTVQNIVATEFTRGVILLVQ